MITVDDSEILLNYLEDKDENFNEIMVLIQKSFVAYSYGKGDVLWKLNTKPRSTP